MNRRRGYLLIEIMFAIGLLGIVLNMAVRLTAGLFETTRQLAATEQTEAAIDQATRMLRRDVESSGRVTPGTNAVTLDAAAWSVQGTTLVRTRGGQARRFEALPKPLLAATADGVTLRLGEAICSYRPLLMAGGLR